MGTKRGDITGFVDSAAARLEQELVGLFFAAPSDATFTPVFQRFAPRMLRYFELRGCPKAVAEDLTQEVMLAAFRQTATIRDPARFRAWLYGVARHKHLMHLRRECHNPDIVEFDELSESLLAASWDPLSRSVLYQSLATLDAVSRRILLLRYLDGLEYHEIAEVMKIPLGTVQWKVFDSKKKLARWMGGL
jgi:RNA polymerase sigma-70 factor (ECF subfamily)